MVHEIFQTDTADYADILLPATTQLEQTDIHSSYGHLYALANNAAIAPLGEAKPNTEVFRLLAARMGFDEPCFRDSDDDLARQAYNVRAPARRGHRLGHAEGEGLPAARGARCPTRRLRTATFRRRRANASSSRRRSRRRATIRCRRSCRRANRSRAIRRSPQRYPLAFLSPPARNFLNSSFANLPRFVDERKDAEARHPSRRRRARGDRDGDIVRIFNDRGSFTATARVTDRARPGVVVAPSIWWKKLSPDGANANAVTSQALTDLGRAATFYDCLVEVAKA